MTDRTAVKDFELANPIYTGAVVTFYTVSNGVKTSTKATLYEAPTGNYTLSNPQTLDSEGKFVQPVYIAEPVIATVSGLTIPDHDTGIIRDIGSIAFLLMQPGIAAAGAYAAAARKAQQKADQLVRLAENARNGAFAALGATQMAIAAKLRAIPATVFGYASTYVNQCAGWSAAAAVSRRRAKASELAAAASAADAAAAAGTFDQAQNALYTQVFS